MTRFETAELPRVIASTFRVGRYRCSVSVPINLPPGAAIHLNVEWHPHLPSRLSKKELKEYRRGRRTLLLEVSKYVGRIAIVDI